MVKQHRHRKGKVATGGHSTVLEGLRGAFLGHLEAWDEIEGIRLGPISAGRAVAGGRLTFRATRWAQIGERITGVKCEAARGTRVQQVVLTSPDPEALRRRLATEGYCNW